MRATTRPSRRPPVIDAAAILIVSHAPSSRKESVRYRKNSLIAYVTGCTPPRTGSPTDLLPEDLDRNDEAGIYPIFLEQPPLRPVRLESLESFLDRSRKLHIAFLDRDADLDSGVEGERALERIPICPCTTWFWSMRSCGRIGIRSSARPHRPEPGRT